MMTITRRYHFSASHRLHSHSLSPSENASLYGKCNNPFGHGHNYVLAVTVSGNSDSKSGLLLPRGHLDRLVQDKILQVFAHRNLNIDVPQFERSVPTTENLALVVAEILQENWIGYLGDFPVQLYSVHIQETDRNGFTVLLDRSQMEAAISHA